MLNRQHRKAKVLFGVSDIVLATLAFEAAYRIRVSLHFEREFALDPAKKMLVLGFSVLAWVLIGRWLRVYDQLDSGSPRVILRDTFRQCLYGSAGLVLFEYLLRLDLSRSFLGLFAAGSWILLCLFRLTAGNLVGFIRREFGAPHYVMIVGTGEQARQVGAALEQSAPYGVRLLGFLATERDGGTAEIALQAAYPVHPVEELRGMLRRQVIDDVVFAVTSDKLAGLEEVFLLCDEEGVRTRLVVDFFPHVNSKVSLEQLGAKPLLTFAAAPNDEILLLLKRLMDILLAAAGLVALFPLMAIIALLVRLTSRGPAIFIQERCGLNGRRFRFYKFRSMCENAEELRPQLEHLSRRATALKIPDDPRLTPLGRYLRKFSIDEWPQLWNVLKGDMSLVGPRPAVPEEVEQYQQWQRRRLRMRPGLTCLWAVAGRDRVDFETWMKLDLNYIDNWSLALDWKILLKTIPRVLTGSGAS
ncbi:MAG: sugar transferase [Candidatus Solibacter usitatus]|nr:sugar transferase [Candidatus Solibacter usitatus]